MSETRITNDGMDVVYRMPPWVAEELADILIRAATFRVDGAVRKPKDYDRGWLGDAQGLMDEADSLRELA